MHFQSATIRVFLCIMSTIAPATHQYKLKLPLCYENHIRGEYYFNSPSSCHKFNTTHQSLCSADVYNPVKDFLKINIVTCEMFESTTSTTFFFFGAKSHVDKTFSTAPPSVASCITWHQSLHSQCCGSLSPQTSHSWATSNTPILKYVWPTSHKEKVRNAVLTESIAVYNHLHKQLVNPLFNMQKCDIHKGSCINGNKVHIWSAPDRVDCPPVSKTHSVENVSLHFSPNGSLYRAEIKNLGISLHAQIKCPISTYACFPKNTFCDPSGIIIVPHNCSTLSLLHFRHLADIHARRHSSNRLYSLFINENADLVHETFHELTTNVQYLECQIQHLFSTIYSILGRQFPGQVLSSVLQRPVAAITVGDTLKELVCIPTNMTLLPHLRHERYFATRPIVQFLNKKGNLTLGQLYHDGHVYAGVHFIETYVPGRVFTFRILDRFYTFQNYSLVHSHTKVQLLSPTLAPLHINFEAPDYEAVNDIFPASTVGFEDIAAILQTINDANIMHQRFNSLLLDRDSPTTSADLDYVVDTTSAALKSVFIRFLSSITNPILSALLSFLFCLSLIWSLILTIVTIKNIPSFLRRRSKPTPV